MSLFYFVGFIFFQIKSLSLILIVYVFYSNFDDTFHDIFISWHPFYRPVKVQFHL